MNTKLLSEKKRWKMFDSIIMEWVEMSFGFDFIKQHNYVESFFLTLNTYVKLCIVPTHCLRHKRDL